jgi:ribonuclease T1
MTGDDSSSGTVPPGRAAGSPRPAGRTGPRVLAQLSARSLLIAATVVIVALIGVVGVAQLVAPAADRAPASASATPSSGLPTVAVAALPPEARAVLALIDKGGPFEYRQDGTVFSNVEGLLPARPAGYYHEYTVVTPGSPDRGTRRLVVGRDGDVYYTSDHYASFRQVLR